ncbi:MAG: acetylglutamate kinase [Clostridiales bacterium]
MKEIIKKAEILIEALPYIQKLYGKTVVIKYGGNAMVNENLKNSVIEDITLLKYIGMNPVVVHGGGPDITSALEKFKIKSDFVEGLRVTDSDTIKTVQMVLIGKVNKEIVSLINKKGGKALGFSGIDGKIIECEKYMPKVNNKHVDIGYVGKVTKINSHVLELTAKDDYIPIIAPIGIGSDNKSYNINADTVASEISIALKAEKLMLLTDVEGVKTSKKNSEIIPALTINEVGNLIESKVIEGGMIPKVQGCVRALKSGVGRTHIVDGRIPHCLLLEIFTNKGIGTMIMEKKVLYHNTEKL